MIILTGQTEETMFLAALYDDPVPDTLMFLEVAVFLGASHI